MVCVCVCVIDTCVTILGYVCVSLYIRLCVCHRYLCHCILGGVCVGVSVIQYLR